MKFIFNFFYLFLIFFSSPFKGYSNEYSKIDITLSDTLNFPGGWSLAAEEIYLSLKYCTYQNVFKILEFGAGAGTICLKELLTKKNINFEYSVFENDKSYIKNDDKITYYYYYLPNVPFERCSEWDHYVAEYEMPNLDLFDLIIIDGPHGVARAQWYSKIKKFTKPGTIILIDDYHHFKEFENELERNFKFVSIIEFNQNPNWKIINDGMEKLKNTSLNKTFKIVQIL